MHRGLFFFIFLAVNIISVEMDFTWGMYLTKPFLIPLLAWQLPSGHWLRLRWIWFALIFSCIGDVLLMLPFDWFLFGLGSFLIAHFFYIRHFWGVWDREHVPFRWIPTLVIGIYLAGLLFLLSPILGDLKGPVIVYGLVISAMLLLAFHSGRSGYQWGACLFVLSDSLLAINKFHTPLPLAGLLVMATYGAAQYLLVRTARQ